MVSKYTVKYLGMKRHMSVSYSQVIQEKKLWRQRKRACKQAHAKTLTSDERGEGMREFFGLFNFSVNLKLI